MLVALLLALVAGVPQAPLAVHHLTFIAPPGISDGDITVEVGGTRATIVRVEHVTHPTGDATDRLIVFLVDEGHIPTATLPAVKEMVSSIVREAAPGAAFALETTSRRVRLAETADREVVVDALSRLDASFNRMRSARFGARYWEGDQDSTTALVRSYSEESALDALTRTASLFTNDGRRHVLVWLTSESAEARWSARGERAATGLMDHSVWMYGIDTTAAPKLVKDGHAPIPADADEMIPLVEPQRKFHVLKTVSERCGGFALVSGTDLRGALTRLLDAIDNYYDVAFMLQGVTRPGAFVSVTSRRPDVLLQTRERFGLGR